MSNSARMKEYKKTIGGQVSRMFGSTRNTNRGKRALPTYTKQEFKDFVLITNKIDFERIYNDWVASGHMKNLTPSIDRIDNSLGYVFSNMRVTTWEDNDNKGNADVISGDIHMGHKAVSQFDKSGNLIDTYISAHEAERKTGVSHQHIGKCCNEIPTFKSAGGFIWKFEQMREERHD